MTEHDVLILGAGSGGYSCALRAAQLGLDVALVEADKLGGTCLHVGCIPTKALLHAAEIADGTREAARFGVRATLEGIDLEAVGAYRTGVVDRLFRGLKGLVSSRGIEVVEGWGTITGPGEVQVRDAAGETRTVRGRHLVIATGSRPRSLPGITIDGERVLDSTSALALTTLPERAVVLGGGVIGSEFASAWRSFGVEVTVLEAADTLLPGEEPTSSAALRRAFRKRGIDVRTGTTVRSAERSDSGVRIELADGESLDADVLLVAVGREPVTDGIGLESIGVATDRGFVPTDEHLATGVERTWAVGDIVPGLQLAHRGFAHGLRVAEQIAGRSPLPVPESTIPRVTYSEPEVASVGLTTAQAQAEHGADQVATLTYDLAGNGRSQILGAQGHVTVVRRVDGPVLGMHLVGSRVGELIGEAQLIVGWEAHPDDVTPHLHAHPTQNEALGEAILALAGTPLHAHS